MLGSHKTCKKLIPQKQNKNFISLQKILIIFYDLNTLYGRWPVNLPRPRQFPGKISWIVVFVLSMVIALLKLTIILKFIFSIYKNKTLAHICKMKTI